MTPEEFRRFGHQLIDRIADYRAGIDKLPVMAQVKPGDLKSALPKAPPMEGEAFEAVLGDLDRLILPGLSHFQHPGF
jgi:aromatic-L-amino-acid decarboxylase